MAFSLQNACFAIGSYYTYLNNKYLYQSKDMNLT